MSEEKLDRIDRRLNELVTVTGNLVIAVRGLNDKYESLVDKYDSLDDRLKALSEEVNSIKITQLETNRSIKTNNAILDDALNRIIDLQKGQNEIGSRVENLENRVKTVEEKIAA